MRTHQYKLAVRWTGNTGSGTSTYTGYSRNHELSGEAKAVAISLSSDPAFRGDRARYSPEEMLVGSLSSCHMLWFLHLCASAGLVVVEYEDSPLGTMEEDASGGGRFTEVVLRPAVQLQNAGNREAELPALHEQAHEKCFIAQSVNFPVLVRPLTAVSSS